MKPSRLLLVSEPGKDGVFDYVTGLAAHLRTRHPEVIVDLAYSSRRSGAKLAQTVADIRAAGGEAVDLNIGNAPHPSDFTACRKLVGLVRQHKHQLVHAHSSKAGALCRILRLLRPGFPPVVYTPHAYFGLDGSRSAKARLFNAIEAILGYIGTTINSSHDERRFGLESLHLPARRLVLIDNGVDLRRFRAASPEEKLRCREALNLPANAIIIAAVGRDSYQKNYAPVYRAMDRLLARASIPLFFAHAGAGSGALGQTLSSAARDKFRSFEYLDPVEQLFFAADAYILTSRYEGLSLGGLQALACGLKVFLSRVTGNACLERIGFRDITWIKPQTGEEEMAAVIERVLETWLASPAPPGPGQIARAKRSISSEIQFEKVCRLYEHVIQA